MSKHRAHPRCLHGKVAHYVEGEEEEKASCSSCHSDLSAPASQTDNEIAEGYPDQVLNCHLLLTKAVDPLADH